MKDSDIGSPQDFSQFIVAEGGDGVFAQVNQSRIDGANSLILGGQDNWIKSGDNVTLIGCVGVEEDRDNALWIANVDFTDHKDRDEMAAALLSYLREISR